jgi:hypothetical protein
MFLTWLHRKLWQVSSSRRQRRSAVRCKSTRPRLEPLEDRLLLSTYLVTNTNDSGVGSLRQAIINVDNGSGGDIIAYDIDGGGVQTIQPTTALPTITQSVTIDGTTQPGYAGTPLIELAGNLAGSQTDGLTITADNSVVRGLDIDRFGGAGVNLQGNGDQIEGCFLGTDITGTHSLSNGSGVIMSGSGDLIGGTAAGARNVISGNQGDGVTILAGNANLVEGNYIGTDVTGATALGNRLNGVETDPGPSNVTIGGTATGAGNVISGNQLDGVLLKGVFPPTNISTGNVVAGNKIGTDATGTLALGNHLFGVDITNSSGNTIGGPTVGARNIISGNAFAGVNITGPGNTVQGNFIGTDVTGTTALRNGRDGVDVTGTTGNVIGGSAAGAGNLISGNSGAGVVLFVASGNQVQGNDIGTDVTASVALGNQFAGIDSEQSSSDTIGGTAAGARNIISGNGGSGVLIDLGSGNLVEGNYIGTDATGTAALANGGEGVDSITSDEVSSGNTIGGTAAGAGNLISGNASYGVFLDGPRNMVAGNFIGTDATGAAALGNLIGVFIFRPSPLISSGDTVGGTAAGARNLISGNHGDGIQLVSGGGDVMEGNYIGTDATGTVALGNGGNGIDVLGSSNDTIGGAVPGAGNLISGNHGDGVFLGLDDAADSPTANILQGNLIGSDATGTKALPNNGNGVDINRGLGNTVGGTAAGARNLISGNQLAGVYFDNGTQNVVEGNYVGTDPTGTAPLGNGGDGVEVVGSSSNIIGGVDPGAGNLISGNSGDGIFLGVASNGANPNSNLLQGNLIGTDVTGTQAVGNGGNGVDINSGLGNTVGGTSPGARNLISGNQRDGVLLSGGASNVVEGNFIGTDVTGTKALGNLNAGVDLESDMNDTVGGTSPGARNLISGNQRDGVLLSGGASNVVEGNFIGTDVTGTKALGNLNAGVDLESDLDDTVGGTSPGARNLISGNQGNGIMGAAPAVGGNYLIEGNFIGTDVSGSKVLGNSGFGIEMDGVPNTTIGGTAAGAGNLISGNSTAILMFFGRDNVVQGNIIGTDVTGTKALGNGGGLVIQFEDGDTIGGTAAGAGNLISGNQGGGITFNRDNGFLVQGNTIGTDISGTVALGNGGDGIQLVGSVSNTTIGGTTAGARNLISGNEGDGILMDQVSGNVVEGNYIGTDATGTKALGNAANGVEITDRSSSNTVGGTVAGAGNLISGNGQNGVLIDQSASGGGVPLNLVQGNLIGTNSTGNAAIGNGANGVELQGQGAGGAECNMIGGTAFGAGNVISGNKANGILLAGAFNNIIQGNLIGTDISGTKPLGNGANGVAIQTPFGELNTIGGTLPRAGNTIAFNGNDGVLVDTGRDNAILSDLIFSSGHLGIELINNGNNNQAPPQLLKAVQAGPNTVIRGILQSTPKTTFTLQFFSDPSPDPSGLGEGQQLLGTTTVTTNGNGFAAFAFVARTRVPAGQIITATATDPNNNTSEFSFPLGVTDGGNARQAIPDQQQPVAALALSGGVNSVSQTRSPLGNQPQPATTAAVSALLRRALRKKLVGQSILTEGAE